METGAITILATAWRITIVGNIDWLTSEVKAMSGVGDANHCVVGGCLT